MPALVRLSTVSNKVNGTYKGAAHVTPIFYLPHLFVTEPLAHCRTILLQSLCIGKWFGSRCLPGQRALAVALAPCSISLYDTMKATGMKQDGTNGWDSTCSTYGEHNQFFLYIHNMTFFSLKMSNVRVILAREMNIMS
jgi:hypothetical protein